VLRALTEEEKQARARALEGARHAEEEARRRALDDARRQAEEDARLSVEREAAARRQAEEEARKRTEEEARQRAEEEAARRLAAEKPAEATDAGLRRPVVGAPLPVADDEEEEAPKRKGAPAKPLAGRRDAGERRRTGKLTITRALDDEGERQRSLAAVRRAREREKRHQAQMREAPRKVVREVVIPDAITVQELANRMAERGSDVVRALMRMGVMVTITQSIDQDTAQLIAEEFGHVAKRVSEADVEEGLMTATDDETALQPRPPVVTVMGHVDHGKTSLLDAIRKTDVVSGEAGGITQHIGAYQVVTESGGRITFIDTPGHAAFTAMRARGAKVTDIVILVVAADDGVMPQTVEAINHARAAHVPIIVAVNKMDKPGADPNRVRQELLQHEVFTEDMGGDVVSVEVSAVQRTNVDRLLEMVLLQAELLDLSANPDRPAEGAVIEARLDRGRGPVATLLVQRGTLRAGDTLVAGAESGRVRALLNDRGEQVTEAGPSTPVEILGLNATPEAGDTFVAVENEARAREISDFRQRKQRDAKAATGTRSTLEQMMSQLRESDSKELPIVIKGDVQGSVEAITAALDKLGTEDVRARVLHSGVGGVTESDVTLAQASGAVIIAFNVRANKQARDLAARDGVEIRYYSIIYDLIDNVRNAMAGLLAPTIVERPLGAAEVREVFSVSKVGKVAGCLVVDGVVRRGAKARLVRDDVVLHEGAIATLKRFKDDVREVQAGTECGMGFERFHDMQAGDTIEVFEVEEVARTL
jgi:translation initiation factor IF-2